MFYRSASRGPVVANDGNALKGLTVNWVMFFLEDFSRHYIHSSPHANTYYNNTTVIHLLCFIGPCAFMYEGRRSFGVAVQHRIKQAFLIERANDLSRRRIQSWI